MKVLIFSLGRKGGSVKYANEIINRLNCSFSKVFVSKFCIEEKPKNSIEVPTYKGKISFIVSSFFFLPFFIIFLLIYNVKYKFDVIYFPYFHYWNYPIIKAMNFFFKIKVVSTVHDGIPHLGDGKPFEKFLNYKCIINSDKLIFLTNHVKNIVEKWIGKKFNYAIIPHGIFHYKNLLTFPRKKKDKLTFLFLGRVSKYKGIELLLEAFKEIDCEKYNKLIIAGKWQYKIDINRFNKCSKLEIIDKFLEEEEISYYVNNSDVLILPYIEATQSGVIAIGISACIPMIITDVGGLSEQLDANEAIFIKPDKNDLRKAINFIIENNDKYYELSNNLFKKQELLKWDKIANNICKELENE